MSSLVSLRRTAAENFHSVKTGELMVHLISAILACFGVVPALAGLSVACAIFGVLTFAWYAVFETPLGRQNCWPRKRS